MVSVPGRVLQVINAHVTFVLPDSHIFLLADGAAFSALAC